MGNHQSMISCLFCFTTSPLSNPPTPSSYFLHSLGNHHHHHQQHADSPTTAAEIMLEAPGCIVSSADDMRRTGRVTAMKADEVLLAGKTYLVVPMSRLHCKVSEKEMEIISGLELLKEKVRQREGFRGRRRSSKISPDVAVQEDEVNTMVRNKELSNDDDVDHDDGVGFCSQQKIRYGNNNNRRWSPVLEPILE